MKNPTLSCPYDQKNVNSINLHYIMDQKSQKTSNLSKTRCSHVNFCSNFTWKTSCSSPYLVIKRQLCQNYTLLWAQKVNNVIFFCDFSQKISALMAIFCQKRSFSKKHTVFSCPYFAKKPHCSHAHILSKKRLFSQKHNALMLFFSNFHGKPPSITCPYKVKKR